MSRKSISSDWFVEASQSGQPTVFFNGKALHSRFDPIKEAQQIVKSIPGNETGIIVLAGFGLGYVAEAILENFPNCRLIIVDADENAIERAVQVRNLVELLNHPNVQWVVGGNPSDIRSFLAGGPVGAKIYFLPWRPAIHINPEWYAELEKTVAITSKRRQVNAHTLEKFGRIWVRNLVLNRQILTRAISLDMGYNKFSELPALILAGGPSLEDIIPHLKDLFRRFLVIAVDTALNAALRAEIIPDVIVSVDPQYWNSRHLDWCSQFTKDTLLFAETAAHPAIFRSLKGPCMLMRSRFPLGTIFEDAVGLKGELMAGGSVATVAWELARYFGCAPMIVAGLDLGYPNLKTHYTGSLFRQLPHSSSTRIYPSQTRFFQALNNAFPHWVKDMAGRPLISDARMDVYHSWFVESISSLSNRNPSVLGTRGRFIKGMKICTIDELFNFPEICHEKNSRLDKLKQTSLSINAEESLMEANSNLITALLRIKALSKKGMEIARETLNISNTDKFQKNLERLSNIDNELMSGDGLDIVSFLLQPIILSITSISRNSKENPIDISLDLYTEIHDVAALHLEIMDSASQENLNFCR